MNPQLQEILHNITTRLTKLEQAEKQEPAGYLKAGYYFFPSNPIPRSELIPRKEWVGLTDDEYDMCDEHETWRSMYNVAAKLKEKNNG